MNMNLYTFRLDQFRIDNTRSLHNDTDVVALEMQVGQEDFTLTAQTGDVNTGNHDVGLEFTSVRIDDPTAVITWKLAITNAGHDATQVEDALKQGIDKVGVAAGKTFGLDAAEVAAAMTAIDVGFSLLFANCDGAVAADSLSAARSDFDKLIPANGRIFTNTKTYPGTDSDDGCGGNSSYRVTQTLIRIQAPVGLTTPGDTVNSPDPTRAFIILSRSSGLVLDVTNASSVAGTKIQQFPDTGVPTQHWQLVPVDSGFFQVKSIGTGLVLDVVGASMDDSAQIQQSIAIAGEFSQHWQFIAVPTPPPDLPFPVLGAGSLFFKLRSRLSGKVLDVPARSADPHTFIQQFSDNGGNNQLWQLVSAGAIPLRGVGPGGGGSGPIIP
jgi:hypothetical protein